MEDKNKLLLQRLAEDEETLNAIKEVFLSELSSKKPNLDKNNEQLGAEVRANERAKEIVEEGIKRIKKLKILKVEKQEKTNPGR